MIMMLALDLLVCLLGLTAALNDYVPLQKGINSPNIVLLLNDDQDLLFGGETPMSFSVDFFKQRGSSLSNFFVNTPVCCPSRAALISGRYPHNYLSTDGSGCMHMNVSNDDFQKRTIGVYMKEQGYTTGMFGKLLNPEGMIDFCKSENAKQLPGFDTWFAMCNDNRYFQNLFSVNGELWKSGITSEDYLTSLIGNNSLKFIENSVKAKKPFFAYVAPHAPHAPSTPAPWYQNEFEGRTAPRTPHYNYSATDHHYIVRSQAYLTSMIAADIDEEFRNRWRSILSVDDIMRGIVQLLDQYGQLENTYFIWTSDHGYQLGQFNIPCCKLQPYEHDIRVTLRIAGPGIPKGVEFKEVVSMVDMAPTLIDLVGGTPPEDMDGISFKDVIKNTTDKFKASEFSKSIIEYWSLGHVYRYEHYIDGTNNTFIGVRLLNDTHNMVYVEFYPNEIEHTFREYTPSEYEFYDLNVDPLQMKNAFHDSRYQKVIEELHSYLHRQVVCSGKTCKQT